MSNVTDWTLYERDGRTFWYSETLHQSVWEKPAHIDAAETKSDDSEADRLKSKSQVKTKQTESGKVNSVISEESESAKARYKKSKLPREQVVVRKEKFPANYTNPMYSGWLQDILTESGFVDINVIPRGDFECIFGFVHFDIEHTDKSCTSDCLVRARKSILGISIPESDRSNLPSELSLNNISSSEGTAYDSHKISQQKQTSPQKKNTNQKPKPTSPFQNPKPTSPFQNPTPPNQKSDLPFSNPSFNPQTSPMKVSGFNSTPTFSIPPKPEPIARPTIPVGGAPTSPYQRRPVLGKVSNNSAADKVDDLEGSWRTTAPALSPWRITAPAPRDNSAEVGWRTTAPASRDNSAEVGWRTTAPASRAEDDWTTIAPAPRDKSADRVFHYKSNSKVYNNSSNMNTSPSPLHSQRPTSRPKSNGHTARKPRGEIVAEVTINTIPHVYPEFEDRLLGPLIGDYLVDMTVKDDKVTVYGDNLENVTLCINKITNLDTRSNLLDQNEVIHVFVDESNIKRGSRRGENRYQLDCAKLLRLVTQYRKVQEVVIVGSTNEENIEPVERARRAEWGVGATGQVQIMRRDAGGREVGVDNTIMSQISSRLTRSYPEKRRKIVLLTGDGNSNYDQGSFPEAVERALLSEKWDVEVWNWESSCSRCYKDMAEAYVGRFSLHFLEPYSEFLAC